MKLLPICSSSKGNSAYIGTKDSGIAIDIGCSYKAFCQGLAAINADISAVKAVLITHEHTDHVKGLLTLTKHTSIPIFASEPTLEYLIHNGLIASCAELHTTEELGSAEFDAEISAFATPHDCASSVGYTINFGKYRLGYCTDLGEVTEEVRKNLLNCRTVFLEANYEPDMLRNNPRYPAYLKQRIASDHGHLSNIAAAEFCAELTANGTVSIVLGHLSQENNTPDTAFGRICRRLERAGAQYEKDFMLNIAPVSNTVGDYIAV